MKRSEVYELIDREVEYQGGEDDATRHLSYWLLCIKFVLERAKGSIYGLDLIGALDQICKVAALSVIAMEHNEHRSKLEPAPPKPEPPPVMRYREGYDPVEGINRGERTR